jgi:hypothetical protein
VSRLGQTVKVRVGPSGGCIEWVRGTSEPYFNEGTQQWSAYSTISLSAGTWGIAGGTWYEVVTAGAWRYLSDGDTSPFLSLITLTAPAEITGDSGRICAYRLCNAIGEDEGTEGGQGG